MIWKRLCRNRLGVIVAMRALVSIEAIDSIIFKTVYNRLKTLA